MTFRGYVSVRHYLWYGVIVPVATGLWYYVLFVVLGLAFLAFIMFCGYGWEYTRTWFSH